MWCDTLNGGPKTGPVLRSNYSIIKEILLTDSWEVERTLDPSPFYPNKRGRTTMATVSAEPFPHLPKSLLDVQRHSEKQACPIGPDVPLGEGSSTLPRWQSLSRFPISSLETTVTNRLFPLQLRLLGVGMKLGAEDARENRQIQIAFRAQQTRPGCHGTDSLHSYWVD